MAITLNKVGIEIDGKVYKFYKLTFGFQRKLVEVQSRLHKMRVEIAKKYKIDVSEIDSSDKVPENIQLELAQTSLEIQESIASLFVDPAESKILDNFDSDSLTQLMEALK